MNVRCRGCFRVEEWVGDEVTVVSPGGGRRILAPERAAFATLVASHRKELGPVVGGCSACGQPLVADASEARRPSSWTIAAKDGALTVDEAGEWRVGAERLPEGAARAWVERRFPAAEREDRGRLSAVQALMLFLMVTPVLVWMFSVVFVSMFLYRFPESPP